MDEYQKFLREKSFEDVASGFDVHDTWLSDQLFDFQRAIVKWALKKGRAAIFADTGLGKTAMQLAWANAVHQYSGNRALIVAPLCVAQQTVEEGQKFGIRARYTREMNKDTGIWVTNYEHIEKFDFSFFDGIVLDESSILKHQDSKTRAKIIKLTKQVPFRLSCTATPSPNDHMELGSQAEFLNLMSASEMLSMFFIHDSGETSKWRLKGHGAIRFWEWLSTWAVCIRRPSDLSFSDDGYILPDLRIHQEIVKTGKKLSDRLLDEPARTLSERIDARRVTIDDRVAKCAEIVNRSKGQFLVWCHLNDESKKLKESIEGAVEVTGSDKPSEKERKILGFTSGEIRVMVSKPSIAGFGMNWQHCHQMAFVGLSDSFEQLYQAIRRCYRFGQKNPVEVFLISADLEGEVLRNIKEKQDKHDHMSKMMVEHMRDFSQREILKTSNNKLIYRPETTLRIPSWIGVHNELH